MTRLDFFLFFFFLILFAPFFFPVLTHTQGSGQLGFHSLFTVWAWTGSWVLYNLHTHTHTYNIWHLHGVETHTHHRWRLSISFPSGQHIQFTGGGGNLPTTATTSIQLRQSAPRQNFRLNGTRLFQSTTKEIWAVPAGWYIKSTTLKTKQNKTKVHHQWATFKNSFFFSRRESLNI